MTIEKLKDLAFFPGCSLATSALENYESLRFFCREIGYRLVEISDWNCCGSSSAHAIKPELAIALASRNLALMADCDQVLIACPSCYKRLFQTFLRIKSDPEARAVYTRNWGDRFNPDLEITPFLSFLAEQRFARPGSGFSDRLRGLRFVPYYGCMLARPPVMKDRPSDFGVMEKVLARLGAAACVWASASKCCGTFLSVARPDLVTPKINQMMQGAMAAGADCIVTACSMCHLTLEIRCTSRSKIPVFHFSELLALAVGAGPHQGWFKKHLIDPGPLLKTKGLLD